MEASGLRHSDRHRGRPQLLALFIARPCWTPSMRLQFPQRWQLPQDSPHILSLWFHFCSWTYTTWIFLHCSYLPTYYVSDLLLFLTSPLPVFPFSTSPTFVCVLIPIHRILLMVLFSWPNLVWWSFWWWKCIRIKAIEF